MSDPQSGHRIYDSDYLADQTNYRNAKIHTKKCRFSNFDKLPILWTIWGQLRTKSDQDQKMTVRVSLGPTPIS